jgi:hypothetical protein
MESWFCRLLPIAARNGVDDLASHMADGFRGDRAHWDCRTMLAIVAGALAVGVLIWFVSRLACGRDRRASRCGPKELFATLCRAHRLSWRDSWLLRRLARVQQLDDPARVFPDPDRLDCQDLAPSLKRHAPRLQSLRSRLFADLADVAETG